MTSKTVNTQGYDNMKTAITSLNFHENISRNLINELSSHLGMLERLTSEDVSVAIDKLALKTNYVDISFLANDFEQTDTRASKYYSCRKIFTHKQDKKIKLTIFLDKRSKKKKHFKHKIELNPRLTGYSLMRKTLIKILGRSGVKDHIVCRLDISFRIPDDKVSVDAFYYSTYLKNKQFYGIYRDKSLEEDDLGCDVTLNSGTISTVMCGKNPLRLSIYNQAHKRKNREPFINFEIQFFDKKVSDLLGIVCIKDLHILPQVKPLDFVQFSNVTKIKSSKRKTTDLAHERMGQGVLKVYSLGFHAGRSFGEHRISKNFGNEILSRFSQVRNVKTRESLKSIFSRKYSEDMDHFLLS
ncbi:MAG: hypothetical protein AB7I27_19210 [Bacteriovoracaceae bacterium]